MFRDSRGIADVLAFLMTWATVAFIAATLPPTGDNTVLLMGLLVTVVAVAALVLLGRADDPTCGQCRTARGPTAEERRLRGSFRRHSHPDTAGRPRPRAPGPVAGAALSAAS